MDFCLSLNYFSPLLRETFIESMKNSCYVHNRRDNILMEKQEKI